VENFLRVGNIGENFQEVTPREYFKGERRLTRLIRHPQNKGIGCTK
jgi:hypothetical protein